MSEVSPVLRMRTTACRWREWFVAEDCRLATAPPPRRPLADAELEAVLERMRGLHLPWSRPTEEYLRRTLATTPCLPACGDAGD